MAMDSEKREGGAEIQHNANGILSEPQLDPVTPSLPADEQRTEQRAEQPILSMTKSLEQRVSLPREILVVGCICLAMFTNMVGLGICLDLLHVIGDSFNITNPGLLPWIIAGYSLTVGTFILFTGRIGDLYGWKRMLIIGYVWFAAWSLVCGLAVYSNHVLFIFARVLQGIGPAILLPNGLALLGNLYKPGPRKHVVFAIFGGCAPVGSIVGSVFGALFWLAWWPWVFFSMTIALAIIAVVSATVIPDPQTEKPGRKIRSVGEIVREIDLYGAAVGITALVLFNFAWNQAPTVGWQSPYIIVTLILAVLLVPLFFYIEIKISSKPILPIEVFTSSNAFMLACVSTGWACFGIWVYYLWQTVEVVRGNSPLLAIAWLCPIAISGMIAAVTCGLLLGIIGPAWSMVIAMAAFLVGILLLVTVPPGQIYWGQIFVTTIITPIGMNFTFPSATIIVSNSLKKEHQGVAASLINTIVNYSISLGLGVAGTIEMSVNHGGKTLRDVQLGYRGAMYFGVGLAGLGLAVASVFLAKTYWDKHKQAREASKVGKMAQNRGEE